MRAIHRTPIIGPAWHNVVKATSLGFDERLGGGNIVAWGLGSGQASFSNAIATPKKKINIGYKPRWRNSISVPVFWNNAYDDVVADAQQKQMNADSYYQQYIYLQDSGADQSEINSAYDNYIAAQNAADIAVGYMNSDEAQAMKAAEEQRAAEAAALLRWEEEQAAVYQAQLESTKAAEAARAIAAAEQAARDAEAAQQAQAMMQAEAEKQALVQAEATRQAQLAAEAAYQEQMRNNTIQAQVAAEQAAYALKQQQLAEQQAQYALEARIAADADAAYQAQQALELKNRLAEEAAAVAAQQERARIAAEELANAQAAIEAEAARQEQRQEEIAILIAENEQIIEQAATQEEVDQAKLTIENLEGQAAIGSDPEFMHVYQVQIKEASKELELANNGVVITAERAATTTETIAYNLGVELAAAEQHLENLINSGASQYELQVAQAEVNDASVAAANAEADHEHNVAQVEFAQAVVNGEVPVAVSETAYIDPALQSTTTTKTKKVSLPVDTTETEIQIAASIAIAGLLILL